MPSSIIATLVVGLLAGCASLEDEGPELGVVHPGVFKMVLCWISDTAYPVVTEVNLDAVATNRNQFDKSEIRQVEGSVIVRGVYEGRGIQSYSVLEANPPRYKVAYYDNGGGRLTTRDIIEFDVRYRAVEINGSPTRIRVLRVLSVQSWPFPERPPR